LVVVVEVVVILVVVASVVPLVVVVVGGGIVDGTVVVVVFPVTSPVVVVNVGPGVKVTDTVVVVLMVVGGTAVVVEGGGVVVEPSGIPQSERISTIVPIILPVAKGLAKRIWLVTDRFTGRASYQEWACALSATPVGAKANELTVLMDTRPSGVASENTSS
jgi:hypothetical protein